MYNKNSRKTYSNKNYKSNLSRFPWKKSFDLSRIKFSYHSANSCGISPKKIWQTLTSVLLFVLMLTSNNIKIPWTDFFLWECGLLYHSSWACVQSYNHSHLKLYMTRKFFSAYLKGILKYKRMVFLFLKYLFFISEILTSLS